MRPPRSDRPELDGEFEVIELDVTAILAGSHLMTLIREGHCSERVLDAPIVVRGLGPNLGKAALRRM